MTADGSVAFRVALGSVGEVRSLRSTATDVPSDVVTCLEAEVRAIQFVFEEGAAPSTIRFTVALRHHPAVVHRIAALSVDESAIVTSGPGTLDVAALTRMIRTRRRQLEACWDGTASGGAMVFELTVSEAGTVHDTRVTSSTIPLAVSSCVLGIVARFRFRPPPTGGAVSCSVPTSFAIE